jgi:hypothetical protein
MPTRVSTKGQVVLPSRIRNKLGFARAIRSMPASKVAASYLRPAKSAQRVSIIRDPVAGFPVQSGGPNAPAIASKQVHEISSAFP